jgi:NAD-dependent deacetylase
MEDAIDEVSSADFLIVVGTSMQVYPAASLVDFVPEHCLIYVIDPSAIVVRSRQKVVYFQEVATKGMEMVAIQLRSQLVI